MVGSAGPYVLVHDLGTTGDKAVLFDVEKGAVVASALRSYPTTHPRPLWAEQDPDDWWRAFTETTRELLRTARVDPGDIEAVGLSGQMMACLPVDWGGRHLRRAIIWMDQRSVSEAERIREVVGEWEFYRITGNRVSPTYPVAKIMWLRRREPRIYEEAHLFLQPKDYVVARLTGSFYTDYSDASLSGMMDASKRTWAVEMLEELGIDPGKLPEIAPSTQIVGEVTSGAAEATGLARGTPVAMGCGDGACATLGAGAVGVGDAYIYVGASAWLSVTARGPVFDRAMRTFNMAHVDPELYSPIGTMQTAGASLRWFRDNVFLLEKAVAEALGLSPYQLIDREAEGSPPGALGLLFLPYLTGERTPHADPHARGGWVGLNIRHTRAHLIRALLEGVGFGMRDSLEIIRGMGVPVREIRVSGGGARSALWRQILADIYAHD
ncbi:MAG: xylulokinase, partial [Thermoprotei archaeon]